MQPCIRIAAWHLHVNAATVRNKNDALSLNPLHYSVFCLSFRPTNSNFSDFFVSGRDGRDGKPGKRSSYLTLTLKLAGQYASAAKTSSETPVVRAVTVTRQTEALASVSCCIFCCFLFLKGESKTLLSI